MIALAASQQWADWPSVVVFVAMLAAFVAWEWIHRGPPHA